MSNVGLEPTLCILIDMQYILSNQHYLGTFVSYDHLQQSTYWFPQCQVYMPEWLTRWLYICVMEIQKIEAKSLLKLKGAISRTTGPIIGLFVLISMNILCWIQIWQWKFEIRSVLKIFKILTCHLCFTSMRRRLKPTWYTIYSSNTLLDLFVHSTNRPLQRKGNPNNFTYIFHSPQKMAQEILHNF